MTRFVVWRLDGLTPERYVWRMAKRKTTYYIDEGVLTATKMTAVASHRSESQLVEDALRRYVVEEGRGEAAREDLRRLLDELRARPELSDLSDKDSLELAVLETRSVRQARRRGHKSA
jgi:Arc/MetJ family transcription regulator